MAVIRLTLVVAVLAVVVLILNTQRIQAAPHHTLSKERSRAELRKHVSELEEGAMNWIKGILQNGWSNTTGLPQNSNSPPLPAPEKPPSDELSFEAKGLGANKPLLKKESAKLVRSLMPSAIQRKSKLKLIFPKPNTFPLWEDDMVESLKKNNKPKLVVAKYETRVFPEILVEYIGFSTSTNWPKKEADEHTVVFVFQGVEQSKSAAYVPDHFIPPDLTVEKMARGKFEQSDWDAAKDAAWYIRQRTASNGVLGPDVGLREVVSTLGSHDNEDLRGRIQLNKDNTISIEPHIGVLSLKHWSQSFLVSERDFMRGWRVANGGSAILYKEPMSPWWSPSTQIHHEDSYLNKRRDIKLTNFEVWAWDS